MWGTPFSSSGTEIVIRFIPTRVGNSAASESFAVLLAVHPHACGELSFKDVFYIYPDGSSPRVWGTLLKTNVGGPVCRFIPTRVGNSEVQPVTMRCVPVHPHACGELPTRGKYRNPISGSSPRVWGTLSRPVSL
ncbi:putative CRISPR associated hypothetical protein [Methanosarcina sp. WWM596]|nr:putative CRISPR associated hypothetical protein [Methanosarcina sp. WWM596]